VEQAEIENLVTELELRVDRLRSLYDQYFMGIEKLEPGVPRKDVDRRIALLRKEQIRNTGLRFRFLMLVQRYNTYQTHWQRICREIENGTYKRHMMRAQARFGNDAQTATRRRSVAPPAPTKDGVHDAPSPFATDAAILEDEDFAAFAALEPPPAMKKRTYDVELDFGDLGDPLDREPSSLRIPVASPAASVPKPSPRPPPTPVATAPASGPMWRKAAPAPPRAPAAAPPVPPPPARPIAPPAPKPAVPAPPPPRPAAPVRPVSPGDLPDERVRQLYSQYVETKRKQNESTAAITYDNLAKSLRESSAKLREKHGRAVDFEVAVKDGKTILKPVVK
jgi:hypothetical protein